MNLIIYNLIILLLVYLTVVFTDLPPRPNMVAKSKFNQSQLVTEVLDHTPERQKPPPVDPNKIEWDKMQVQDYYKRDAKITNKKR